ncbi:MAG: YncE family protein, partial [Thermoplasmata archaeon]
MRVRRPISARVGVWILLSIIIFILTVSFQPTISSPFDPALRADSPLLSPHDVLPVSSNGSSSIQPNLQAGATATYGAIDPATGDLYVTNAAADTVSVFSSTTGKTLATIPVGIIPWGIAVDPRTNEIYVADRGFVGAAGGNVTVIRGLTVIRTIEVGPSANWVIYDPIANLMYVLDSSPWNPNSNLSAISPVTNSVTAKIAFPTGCFANWDAFDPGNGLDYVTLSYCNEVVVIDATTTSIVGTIRVGNNPLGVAYDPIDSRIYVVDWYGLGSNGCSAVTVISGMTVLQNFFIDKGCGDGAVAFYPPTGMLLFTNGVNFVIYRGSQALESVNFPGLAAFPFYDPSNGQMYIPNSNNGVVLDVNGPWFNPVGTVYSGLSAGVAVTSQGEEYIAQYDSGTVIVISEATNKILKRITVGLGPYGVVYDPSSNAIYVTDELEAEVSVINANTRSVTTTVSVGVQPEGISYDPVHHQIDVANFASNSLTVINDYSNHVTATVAVGRGPVGVDASTGTVYVSNSFADSVTVVSGRTHAVLT